MISVWLSPDEPLTQDAVILSPIIKTPPVPVAPERLTFTAVTTGKSGWMVIVTLSGVVSDSWEPPFTSASRTSSWNTNVCAVSPVDIDGAVKLRVALSVKVVSFVQDESVPLTNVHL